MKKITAVFFALATLSFSSGISVAFHYCGGRLAQSKIVFGNNHAGCGMEEKGVCSNHSSPSLDKTPCCNNMFQKIATEDFTPATISKKTLVEFSQLSLPSLQIFSFPERAYFFFLRYRPPPGLSSVLLPFISVFLI